MDQSAESHRFGGKRSSDPGSAFDSGLKLEFQLQCPFESDPVIGAAAINLKFPKLFFCKNDARRKEGAEALPRQWRSPVVP